MKIKTIEDLEKVLTTEYGAEISSVDEVNSYPEYSLVGDNEHDYSLLHAVYKIKYEDSTENPYDIIFFLLFSKNGGIFDIKGLGEEPPSMRSIWRNIQWEEN